MHNALLVTRQVCHVCNCARDVHVVTCAIVRVVLAVSSIACAVLPLVLVPRLVVYVPNSLSCVQDWSVGRDRILSITTPPLQTLSRHKIFCRDKNGSTLGKLCRDTRGPLSRPKHPFPAPNPVVTQNFYRDVGPKIYISIEKASVATQTAQHALKPYRDMNILVKTQG